MSSFRKFGGMNFSPNSNIVKHNILNANSSSFQTSGLLNSKEVFLSHIDMSGNSLLNVGSIYFTDGTYIDSSFGSNPTLSDVLGYGNSAGVYDIDMSGNSIFNVGDFTQISGTTTLKSTVIDADLTLNLDALQAFNLNDNSPDLNYTHFRMINSLSSNRIFYQLNCDSLNMHNKLIQNGDMFMGFNQGAVGDNLGSLVIGSSTGNLYTEGFGVRFDTPNKTIKFASQKMQINSDVSLNGYLNLCDISNISTSGTQIYQNGEESHWDNNVNGNNSSLTFSFNDAGGTKYYPLFISWFTLLTNVPIGIQGASNYIQFPDTTQQNTAYVPSSIINGVIDPDSIISGSTFKKVGTLTITQSGKYIITINALIMVNSTASLVPFNPVGISLIQAGYSTSNSSFVPSTDPRRAILSPSSGNATYTPFVVGNAWNMHNSSIFDIMTPVTYYLMVKADYSFPIDSLSFIQAQSSFTAFKIS